MRRCARSSFSALSCSSAAERADESAALRDLSEASSAARGRAGRVPSAEEGADEDGRGERGLRAREARGADGPGSEARLWAMGAGAVDVAGRETRFARRKLVGCCEEGSMSGTVSVRHDMASRRAKEAHWEGRAAVQ